jgi:hypothetical protein
MQLKKNTIGNILKHKYQKSQLPQYVVVLSV